VGLGLASGWVPNDFVIDGHQEDFDRRKEVFEEKIGLLRRLWAGETHRAVNPHGEEVDVQTIPRPVQQELPIWITAAANPQTFREAGQMGANLLTHLLGQTTQALGEKIEVYREAWCAAGHPGSGTVTLMLHTLVGSTDEEVHELVREPMKRYLASSLNLAAEHLESVPFLQKADEIDLENVSDDFVDQVLEASFEKYFHMGSLLGSYEKCLDTIDKLAAIGVDEVACLVDFGVDTDTVLNALEKLNVVRVLANEALPDEAEALQAQAG
jgi:natural product biosynthesis luciferase-like monooxygenase protein